MCEVNSQILEDDAAKRREFQKTVACMSPEDYDQHAIKSAFGLARKGKLGSSSSALARVQPSATPPDPDAMVRDLVRLHPPGEEPKLGPEFTNPDRPRHWCSSMVDVEKVRKYI